MARSMILLVSGQPMANLLAALDPALEVTHADLIVSGDMEVSGRAGHLADTLETRGITVATHLVSDVFQPEATRSMVTGLVKQQPERFIINLTGGTKPMVLGAYRAALDWGVRDLLYLDHEQGLLRWLEGNRPPQPSCARLDTALILGAHGFRSAAGEMPTRTAIQLSHSLHEQLRGDTLRQWNQLFGKVERQCRQDRDWTPRDVRLDRIFGTGTEDVAASLDRPLREAAALGFCHWSGNSVRVDRAADHQLLQGGWFELVVHEALLAERASLGIDEVSLNLKVRSADGAANEFDCVARMGSRLIFFEVKTAQMKGTYGTARPKEIFYKLSALKDTAGLTGRACLVSIEPMAPAMARRFAGAGLGLVQGEEATPSRLRYALADWIRAG